MTNKSIYPSPKLELPKDMSDKIFAMLKPTCRPAAVLCFKRRGRYNDIIFRTSTISDEDRVWLLEDGRGDLFESGKSLQNIDVNLENTIHRALCIGFRFQDEVSRERYMNGGDFEMERDAVNGIA